MGWTLRGFVAKMRILMDRLIKGLTESSRVRVTVVDVTVAAKALEARHLCGPVAAAVLAEGVVGVALLSADAATPEEAWMLRLNVSGPIGGLLVEATGAGMLRGFTTRKTLDALDGLLPVASAPALGDTGSVQIVSTLPGRILSQAVLHVSPPQLRFVMARYWNHSQQIPTGCSIHVVADDGGLLTARGLLVQRMEDSDQDAFIGILEALEAGREKDFMLQRVWSEDPAKAIAAALGTGPIRVGEQRPLAFGCRCSKEKTLGVLGTMSLDELDELISGGNSQDVTCHMCGQTYTASVDDLVHVRALAGKAAQEAAVSHPPRTDH